MITPRSFRAFAYTAPGLEGLLAKELTSLRGKEVQAIPEGCEITNLTEPEMWKICTSSRLISGLRIRLGENKRTTKFPVLNRHVSTLPWEYFLPVQSGTRKVRPNIDAVCKESKLFHSNAVSERIREYLEKKKFIPCKDERSLAEKRLLSQIPDDEKENSDLTEPPIHISIHARVVNDMTQISLDTGGDLLSRRGYRTCITEAPIRENLIAACLEAMDYAGQPLFDPFCGSGTILCEALLRYVALHHSEGIAFNQLSSPRREFSYEFWKRFPREYYAEWNHKYVEESRKKFHQFLEKPPTPFFFVASDLSKVSSKAAQQNWNNLLQNRNIGKSNSIQFWKGDFEAALAVFMPEFPTPPILFSNLPYGLRLSVHLNSVYNRLNRALKNDGHKFLDAYVLDGSADNHFLKIASAHGVQWKSVLQFSNGGTGVKLLKLIKDQ